MAAKILMRVTAILIGLMVAPLILGLSLILMMLGGIVSVAAIAFAALVGGLFELLEPPADEWESPASERPSGAVDVHSTTRHAA